MNREAELYDWDMTLEDDDQDTFEDVDEERQDGYVATTPQDWVRFSTDGLNRPESRKEGDGTSIDSQTYVVEPSESDDEIDKDREEQLPREQNGDLSEVYSGRKAYLPTNGQSDTARFKILDDEYDISPDVEPMEFRGSLKTDADTYGKTTGGKCACVRYLAVAVIMFAIGILLGYFAGVRNAPVQSLEVPGHGALGQTEAMLSTTRLTAHNVTSVFTNASVTTQTKIQQPVEGGPQLI